MALQKQKILKNGVAGNYWKIISLSLDRQTRVCTYKIALFLSEQQSQLDHTGLVKTYTFQLTQDESDDNLITLGYNKIKAKAQTLITTDITGHPLDVPIYYDSDLVPVEDV